MEFGTDFIVNMAVVISYVKWFRKSFTCVVPVWMQILMYVIENIFALGTKWEKNS